MVEILLCISSGAILGFFIGLTGVGGGVLTVPVLITILKLEPIAAVGTASLYAVLGRLWAAIQHYSQGTVNLEAALLFLEGALPGVIFGSLSVKWMKVSLPPSGVETLQHTVSYIIIFCIALSLAALFFDYSHLEARFSSGSGRFAKLSTVFVIGVIMGVSSIGGGVLIIPALLLFYKETRKYVGTAIVIALVCMTALSCVYAFVGQGSDVNFKVAVLMAVGSLAGTRYGATLSKRIEPKRLQFVVISVIMLAVIMMIVPRML